MMNPCGSSFVTPSGTSYPANVWAKEAALRKRFTRKYRHWSPRFKWSAKDEAALIEWEREARAVPRRRKRHRRNR